MKLPRYVILLRLSVAFFFALSAGRLHANSLDKVEPHLDRDGNFFAYADFTSAATTFGDHLTAIYQTALQSDTGLPPIPLNFGAVFEQLGFSSVGAIGYSSKEIAPDFYRNQSVLLYASEPKGLLAFTDLTSTPFTAAERAPADSDFALNAHLRFDHLQEAIVGSASTIMGAMGETLILTALHRELLPNGLTGLEIIEALSVPALAFGTQKMDAGGNPDLDFYIELAGSGEFAARLSGLTALNDRIFVETLEDGATLLDFSALTAAAGMQLYLRGATGGPLIIYTDEAFLETPTERLIDAPEFARFASELPSSAGFYSYSAGYNLDGFLSNLRDLPQAAPYLPIVDQFIERIVSDFIAPQVSFSYGIEGGIKTENYAEFSGLEAVVAVPAIFFGGLTGAMAVPAFQKVRQTSQEKAVTNNLRMFASASQQYMLDEGAPEARYADIVGPDKYIQSIESVAGETYEDLVVTADDYTISITLPDGRTISYDF